MPETEHHLQVLIANERDDRLETITAIVEGMGHEIVGKRVDIAEVGPLSRSTGAEVALVGLGLDGEHALEQISAIVREAACPGIARVRSDSSQPEPRSSHWRSSSSLRAGRPTGNVRPMRRRS